jgi:hypothetical protein
VIERVFGYSDHMSSSAQLKVDVVGYATAFDADLVSGETAARVVEDMGVVERAAAVTRMFAAVRVAKTDAWRGQGHASAADWLAAKTGITVREAATQLGTAKKAARLPKTKKAMKSGKLSPSQAGAVTDGAAADPSAEDSLLGSAANDTTAALKDKAAKIKAAATDGPTREKRIHSERTVRTRTDSEGAFCLYLRGPAADGVRLTALTKPYEEQAFRHGRTDGVRDTFENRSYDAFQQFITNSAAALAAAPSPAPTANGATPPTDDDDNADADPGAEPTSTSTSPDDATTDTSARSGPGSGGTGPSPPGTTPPARPKRPPGGNNVKVIVRIDHSALLPGWTVAGETCDVAGLGPISVSAVREIIEGQDPFLAALVTKGRDVVNVAHLGRGLNVHQRTAMEAAGLRCSNIACNKTIALQMDHRYPWGKKQETKLDNQDPFCPDCHRLKTHHGWHLEPGTGPRRFLPPDQPGTAGRGEHTDVQAEQPSLL